jgi:uncharacterized coiled-coil DUF342 family protein
MALPGPLSLISLPVAIERLNDTLNDLLTEVQAMRRGVDRINDGVASLRDDFAAVRGEVVELNEEEVAPMRRRVDSLHDEVVALGERLERIPFVRRRGG